MRSQRNPLINNINVYKSFSKAKCQDLEHQRSRKTNEIVSRLDFSHFHILVQPKEAFVLTFEIKISLKVVLYKNHNMCTQSIKGSTKTMYKSLSQKIFFSRNPWKRVDAGNNHYAKTKENQLSC